MEERLKANPALMQESKQRVEHPCGTITHANDQGDFLMKGRKNGRAEFSLACLAYNLTRAINTLGVPQLLGALSSGGHLRDVGPQSRPGRRPISGSSSEFPHEYALPNPMAPQISVSFHTVWRSTGPLVQPVTGFHVASVHSIADLAPI